MKKNLASRIIATPTGQAWTIIGVSGVLNIILWVLVYATFPQDTPAAVLHYSVGVGVDFIGEGKQITVLPLGGAVLLALNSLAAYVLRRASWTATWILLGSAVLFQVLLIIAYIYILQLNR